MDRIILTLVALAAFVLPATAQAADAEAGRPVFEANCASCHGPEGKGDGPVAVALDPKPRDFSEADFQYDTDGDGEAGTDAEIANLITNGAAAYGGNVMMAPVALSDEDMANVIAFIRSLKR